MSNSSQPRKALRPWLRSLLVVIVIIIIAGAIFVVINLNRNKQTLQTLQGLKTVVFQKGSLTASISGTGTTRANQTALLSWGTSGTVGDVRVRIGEKVSSGQVLVALNETDLPIDILQAEMDVLSVEKSLNDLYNNVSLQLAQVELDLITADTSLDDLQTQRAAMNYQRCTDERLEDLQEKYDDAFDAHDFWPTDATLLAVDTALANLNFCKADYSQEEIAEADARIRLAEENVTSLQRKIEILQQGPDPTEVSLLETQLEIAQARLSHKTITAPFASTITGVYVLAGDLVSTGMKAVQLADLSVLYVDVQISEVDIPLVNLGQSAELVFDAYFEETYLGEIVEIAPIGTETQGVVTYNVTVKLLNGIEIIKSGMTAAVNIITEQKTDAYIVPGEAVVNLDGTDTIYVIRNGVPVAVEVEVGAYSNRNLEILSGEIQDGELIVINPPISILSMMDNNSSFPGFLGGR